MIATHNETGTGFAGLFTKVLDRIHTNVNVNLACGDPRTVGETTIIPVAVVSDGFGLGMGTRPNANADSQAAQESGGGGAWIQPIAIVTITNGKTKVIPVLDLARVLPAMIGAVGKLALSMTVFPTRRKRAVGRNQGIEETDEKE